MGILTDAIQRHHRSLIGTLKAHVRSVGGSAPQSEQEAFVAFLKEDLLPHARGEEQHLYPVLDEVIGKHERPTATMTVDHEFIRSYVEKIEAAIHRAEGTDAAERQRVLRELAIKLDAIVEMHLAKEERVYLPLIERHLGAEQQTQLLQAIHNFYQQEKSMTQQENTAEARTLDVRNVIPRERHTLIFETFERLKPGEAFVLVNDHDPRPLYYQFQAEHTGQFSWDYLEQGPETWRVRIGRRG